MAVCSSGFPPSRFVGQVDDHFVCAICSMVVRDPVECSLCEHLLCQLCSQGLSSCPNCVGAFTSKEVALFASKMYGKLRLHCVNAASGCPKVCAMKDLSTHELDCLYVTVVCASPICSQSFMKKEKLEDPGKPLVCSVVCKTVVEFQGVLETKDQGEILKRFYQFLSEAKTLVEKQVKSDLEPMQREIDQKLQEAREYSKAREDLLAELENRKWLYHPGKWNGSSSAWTCCSVNEKLALGCRKLAA